MKDIRNVFLFLVIITAIISISCNSDDDNANVVIPEINIAIQSPEDGAQAIGYNPTFTWEASGDNPDNFKYDFYIGTDQNKLGLRAANIVGTEYTITNNTVIKGDVTYYWKVIAKDGIYENESEVWSFTTVDGIESPVLVSPGEFVRNTINFQWEEIPPAADEELVFNIYVGENDPPTELIGTVKNASSFSYNAPELEEFKTYYYRVEVLDSLSSAESEVGSFIKLKDGYPDLPYSISPEDKSLVYDRNGDVILDWTDSADPDGDTVTYDVYLGRENPPATVVASFSGDSKYNPTSSLQLYTRYYWYVVAKDPSGNSYSTDVLSFDYVGSDGPATPTISEEVVDGTLSLDESLVWGEVLGAASYDVYIGTSNPPTTKVASDITDPFYVVNTKDTPSNINDVQTFYAQVVAKNIDGQKTSQVISFSPQVTGVYTDVRGSESLDYTWVRLGTQIWMSQNLRATKLTDGSAMVKVVQPTSGSYPISASATEIYYDDHDLPVSGFPDIWAEGDNGRVYSFNARTSNLIAPEGWHVINEADVAVIQSYIPNSANLLDEWYGGTDPYGANFVIAGYRYDTFDAGRPYGFRYDVEKGRVTFWFLGNSTNAWEVYPNRYNKFNQGNPHLRMFGIRLVKDY